MAHATSSMKVSLSEVSTISALPIWSYSCSNQISDGNVEGSGLKFLARFKTFNAQILDLKNITNPVHSAK